MTSRLPLTQSAVIVSGLAFLLFGAALLAQDPPQSGSDGLHNRAGNNMTPPKGVYTPGPVYADRPRKEKIQGTVVVSMVVTAEGTVRDAKVATSLDKELDKKALEAVSKWRFEPATKDGRPVAARVNVSVQFHLY